MIKIVSRPLYVEMTGSGFALILFRQLLVVDVMLLTMALMLMLMLMLRMMMYSMLVTNIKNICRLDLSYAKKNVQHKYFGDSHTQQQYLSGFNETLFQLTIMRWHRRRAHKSHRKNATRASIHCRD